MIKASNNQLSSLQAGRTWKDPFWFVVGADTQLGLENQFKVGRNSSELTWQEEINRINTLINFVNSCSQLPKFIIVCGDLVDAFPGQMHRREQENDFIQSFRNLNKAVPLICVCGNHDVGNSPTNQTLSEYRETFGDDYFSFWVDGTFHIAISSQFFEDDSNCLDESKKHSVWLDRQLEIASTAKYTFAYQHIPPFLETPEEPKQYFNLEFDVRKKLLDKLCNAGVSKLFCGHYHNNAGGWYPSDSNRLLEVVVTTAVGCQLGSDTILPGLEGCWRTPRTKPSIRFVTVNQDLVCHDLKSIDDLESSLST